MWSFLTKVLPLKIVTQAVALIFLSILLYISQSYLTRYLDMNSAINDFNANDFNSSLKSFENPQEYVAVESWKQSFNAGVTDYMLNNQDDARSKFDQAKSESAYLNSVEISCMIDVNIAFSLEKSGVSIKDKSSKNAQDLRLAADFILQAYSLRQNIMKDCQLINAQDFKANSTNSEIDKNQYTEMMQSAFDIDGKNADSVISESNAGINFKERENELNESKVSQDELNPKLKQLVDDNVRAQIEYQNAQNFKNKTNTQTITPW